MFSDVAVDSSSPSHMFLSSVNVANDESTVGGGKMDNSRVDGDLLFLIDESSFGLWPSSNLAQCTDPTRTGRDHLGYSSELQFSLLSCKLVWTSTAH